MNQSNKSAPVAHDLIQERCISAMQALGLNASQVAQRVRLISRTHVTDFLARRKSMGSHKLQHLLPALGLTLSEKAR
jgi:hypothetical protein